MGQVKPAMENARFLVSDRKTFMKLSGNKRVNLSQVHRVLRQTCCHLIIIMIFQDKMCNFCILCRLERKHNVNDDAIILQRVAILRYD